jgi:hypothetical protein
MEMKVIRDGPLCGSGLLALLFGSSVLLAGCSRHEAPEQRTEPPAAPEIAPPIEQQSPDRSEQREIRCPAFPEEVGPEQARGHVPPRAFGKERPPIDRGDVEEFEGHLGFEIGTTARALEARTLHSGPGFGESGTSPVRSGDIISKPLTPAGAQQPYSFTIPMYTPDQTRRGHLMRMDVGDAPYSNPNSTMQPVSPNVSENTVDPFK